MIEDTIRRNASPVRETAGVVGAGSCSSLTSSNSDETHARINRNTAMANQLPYGTMTGNHQKGNVLLHSLSTNDATVGEYKFTVNVGHHNIKITGDSLELVRVSVILSYNVIHLGMKSTDHLNFLAFSDFQTGIGRIFRWQ